MGAMLPKPVESALVERRAYKAFRVGVAEINGWRNSMEDAHLIQMHDDWGLFGVFDGHGGDQCSAFVASRISNEIEKNGCPRDDNSIKKLFLSTDQAFLDTGQPSGTTATMCLVRRPATSGSKLQLCVINAGDSRVLLGRRDGRIVDGGGTDQGLTTDHKPCHPAERQRIYRCGGHVEEAAGGVARVNGELAVSRGFGDADHKRTGGPGPEDRPVTANPEFGHFECDESDFVILVCDGVSEGDFPNPDVVRLVAELIRENDDLGQVARAVCHRAIEANSKDNITCMIVLLNGNSRGEPGPLKEFIPGPLTQTTHKGFMTAYEAMAKKAGLTLAQAAEMRYDLIEKELAQPGLPPAKLEALRMEKSKFGTPSGAKGSVERSRWFSNWQRRLPEQQQQSNDGPDGLDPDMMLMRMLMQRGPGAQDLVGRLMAGAAATANGGSGGGGLRRIRAPGGEALRRAVSEHPALEWNKKMLVIAGKDGLVEEDDPNDGTSKCTFPLDNGGRSIVWLPTNILVAVEDGGMSGSGSSNGASAGTGPAGRGNVPRPYFDQLRQGSPSDNRSSSGSASRYNTLPRLEQRSEVPASGLRGGSPATPVLGGQERPSSFGRRNIVKPAFGEGPAAAAGRGTLGAGKFGGRK